MRIADQFSLGRVHLVGDAAHTMPPQGGMGGNTAVMDGFYLAWKVAAVAQGKAGIRPAGQPRCRAQTSRRVDRGEPVQELRRAQRATSRRSGRHAAHRRPRLLCFGYRQHGAVVPESGDERELLEEPTNPTGRPGSRAPHVPLIDSGETTSTIDLFGRNLVLLTESERAADDVARTLGIAITTHRIGDGQNLSGRWTDAYGVTPQGAVLLRPDPFIAWRSRGPGLASELEAALRTVLDRR